MVDNKKKGAVISTKPQNKATTNRHTPQKGNAPGQGFGKELKQNKEAIAETIKVKNKTSRYKEFENNGNKINEANPLRSPDRLNKIKVAKENKAAVTIQKLVRVGQAKGKVEELKRIANLAKEEEKARKESKAKLVSVYKDNINKSPNKENIEPANKKMKLKPGSSWIR